MSANATIDYDLSTQDAWKESAYEGYQPEGASLETAHDEGTALGAFLKANPLTSDNDNSADNSAKSLLGGAWGDTDVHGKSNPAPSFTLYNSLDKQIEAVQAHLERGQPRRAEALVEKIIERYERKGDLDRVLDLLNEYGLDDLIVTPDYTNDHLALQLKEQDDRWEEEEERRRELEAQAPSF